MDVVNTRGYYRTWCGIGAIFAKRVRVKPVLKTHEISKQGGLQIWHKSEDRLQKSGVTITVPCDFHRSALMEGEVCEDVLINEACLRFDNFYLVKALI